MLLKYFYDKKLAQASYMIGCAKTGEALVVDPARDVTPYLKAAEEEGLRITHITETHIHADYVSGSRELAHRTGGYLYLSDMGDANWKYDYSGDKTIPVRDGDAWMVGNVRIEVLHTPGHTPEHISFLVTDTAGADKPIGVFTGDFLFVGDVGRPDLLDEAAGFVGTKELGARQQFKSVQRFKDMPDYLQIWPAHGAGSACGKALGAIPSSTLGYEKLFNPAFQHEDEDAFVEWLLDGQPEAPLYFGQMKHVNKVGPALLNTITMPENLTAETLQDVLRQGHLVVDARSKEQFADSHVPGTVNIPAGDGGFTTYVGWFVDYNAPLYLIAETAEQAIELIRDLQAIGVDNIPGYFTVDVIVGQTEQLPLMNALELSDRARQNGLVILDVRGKSEYESQRIAGAKHIPLGYLPKYLDEIPQDHTVVTHCASGFRSQIAASLLRKHGFNNVINLNDSIEAWSKYLQTESA